jgi:hypothetical protein
MTHWRRRPMVGEYGPSTLFVIGMAVIIIGVVWQMVRWMH